MYGHLTVGATEAPRAEAAQLVAVTTTPPQIVDIAPPGGQVVNNNKPSIYATYRSPTDVGINPRRVRIEVNGLDVTAAVDAHRPVHHVQPRRRAAGRHGDGEGDDRRQRRQPAVALVDVHRPHALGVGRSRARHRASPSGRACVTLRRARAERVRRRLVGGGGGGGAPLVMARVKDAVVLDPSHATDGLSLNTTNEVLQNIVTFKPGSFDVVGDAAKTWSRAPTARRGRSSCSPASCSPTARRSTRRR